MGIIILGAGGFAREVFFYLKSDGVYTDFIFVDDYNQKKSIQINNTSYVIVNDWNFDSYAGYKFLVGVGNPQLKRKLVLKALEIGLKPAKTFIHSTAQLFDVNIGLGGVIAPGAVITTSVSIGNYLGINLNGTVGHDVLIGDYSQLNPGVHVSGNSTIGELSLLGSGVVINEGLTLNSNLTIGSQSVVVKNLKDPGTYIGVPAKKLIK